jgi:hypothetical protein
VKILRSKEFWVGFVVAYVLAAVLHGGMLKGKGKGKRGKGGT